MKNLHFIFLGLALLAFPAKGLSQITTPDPMFQCPDVVDTVLVGKLQPSGYVDLGLSVEWAVHNIGATSPDQVGDYFSWGELQPKTKFFKKDSKTFGKQFSCIAGNPQYDAATALYGDSVRIPTRAQIDELLSNCIDQTAIYKGTIGKLLTSKKNGNRIFFPAGGSYTDDLLYEKGKIVGYWSATPVEENLKIARCLVNVYFNKNEYFCTDAVAFDRSSGLPIRPIRIK